jgi:hypothetical protein
MACGTTAAMAQRAPSVGVTTSKELSAITLGGRLVYNTSGLISNPKAIGFEGSPRVIVTWNESDRAGGMQSFYGLSLDGGRTLAVSGPTTHLVRLVYSEFDPLQGEPAIAPGLEAGTGNRMYLVQFVAPPMEEMQAQLEREGARIQRFLTDHTHVVAMDPVAAAKVRSLPSVRWVGAYHPAYRLSPEVRAWLASPGDAGSQRFSIECFERGMRDQQAVSDVVRRLGGIVEVTTPDQFRMEATLTREQVLAVAAMNEVNYIDPWGGPGGTDMNIIRQLHGTTDSSGNPVGGFSGQGVRGEVIDTEVRVSHTAFQSPPVLLHRNSAGDSGSPHGSSCYGIIFADWPSNPNYNGMVTSAEQGIFLHYAVASQFGGQATRLTLNTEATNPAGPYWSSFQSSSMGNTQVTAYTTISAEVDDYLFKVDYLSCQSQSNTGNMNSRPQAWAKNIVSVGGVEWRGTLNKADDFWSSASFGPAADQRVKPDLTSCYGDIPTTSNASNSGTTTFGGTSGATPITAGNFGILTQMWHEGVFAGFGGASSVFTSRPRAMTAKAMVINTAYRYPLTQGGLTRAKQGWGLADIGNLYALRNKVLIVNETDLVTNGQTRSYQVCIAPNEPVASFTLCYIDPQGNPAAAQARINDLSLRVTSPGGTVYRGNSGLVANNYSTSGGVFDTRDTVENVFIQNPQAGNWTIDVVATSVVQDAYLATPGVNDVPFALVASGVLGQRPTMSTVGAMPTMISPTTPTTVSIRVVPGCEGVIAGSVTLVHRTSPSSPFTNITMTSMGDGLYSATLPLPVCTDSPQFFFSAAGDQGSVVLLPSDAPTTVYSATVADVVYRFQDDFEQDRGWSGQDPSDNAVTGRWTRNIPQGTEAQPAADHTPAGNMCWVTDFRAGQQVSDYDVDGGKTTLISPVLDAANLNEATISYWRWYSNGVGLLNPNTNVFLVQISNNAGLSWHTVETVGPSGANTEPGWRFHSFRVADFVTPTNQVQVRFIAADYTDSIVEAAVDDFALSGIECRTQCYANCDGSTAAPKLTANDFQCFLGKFAAGDPYANCDGSTAAPVLTANDFQCFLTHFANGCP